MTFLLQVLYLICIIHIQCIIVQHPDYAGNFRIGKLAFSNFGIEDIISHVTTNCYIEEFPISPSNLRLLIKAHEYFSLSMI